MQIGVETPVAKNVHQSEDVRVVRNYLGVKQQMFVLRVDASISV